MHVTLGGGLGRVAANLRATAHIRKPAHLFSTTRCKGSTVGMASKEEAAAKAAAP